MANKKQIPVMAIILIAIIVVAAFFIVRAVRPPRPMAMPMADYMVCLEECPVRFPMEEIMAMEVPLMECPECGAPLVPEEMMLPPEMIPPPE